MRRLSGLVAATLPATVAGATTATATGAGRNGTIPPGGNASFGFQGTWTANDSNPATFRLNGTTCAGG